MIIEIWHTVIDGRQCPTCQEMDGLRFKQGSGPYPPLHSRCRCIRVPVQTVDAQRMTGPEWSRLATELQQSMAKAWKARALPTGLTLAAALASATVIDKLIDAALDPGDDDDATRKGPARRVRRFERRRSP